MTTGRSTRGVIIATGMTGTTIGAKVPPPTISQSVSNAEQLHHQQQHYRSLQRDGASATTVAGGVNPGTWQDGTTAATPTTHYQHYGAVPAYGMHLHHLHQQQGMNPFRSLQRGSSAQLPPGGVHTSHSHSGHFRSSISANKAAPTNQQQQSDACADGTYANNDSERQLYAVTEL